MAVKKINKEFVLSDSSVNVYGFRLLTEGYLMDEFQKNPIGFLMHDRDGGVIVRWEDLRIDGDKILGKPSINLNHPKGADTAEEIENGFYNAASVGNIVALEFSTDPKDLLQGQTGPTATKWFNRECSIVDIPGNYNALANLFDADLNPINLADFSKQNPTKQMKQILFTAVMLAAMNLSSTAEEADVSKAFNDLVAQAAQADKLKKELDDLKDAQTKESNTTMLDKALEKGKITKEIYAKLELKYKSDSTGLKDLLDMMPAYSSVSKKLNNENGDLKDLASKTWDELDRSGQLHDLKEADLEVFKQKYKAKFGQDYKEEK